MAPPTGQFENICRNKRLGFFSGIFTTAGRVGVFLCIHNYIAAGQTEVPNPNMAVMTVEENVSWLWKMILRSVVFVFFFNGECNDAQISDISKM